jgi:hypothetical protein
MSTTLARKIRRIPLQRTKDGVLMFTTPEFIEAKKASIIYNWRVARKGLKKRPANA